ncbi:uncharacterized protein [Eurosta solidaginis]|uniref:uncharacterized protein n=1 Tax=Eurosta solidaginis TaxID=178769 RepID=UPI0035315D2F
MMTNNNVQNSNTNNKISNGKTAAPPPPPPHAHALSSLPRFGSARREKVSANEQAESSLTHEPPYSQHLANQNRQRVGTTTTADRYALRLTQDHFNQNHGPYGSIGRNNKHANTLSGGERSLREFEGNYIHNNSHYSLPLDHALSSDTSTPTPTPTPPALPMRNGQIMHQISNNTTTLQHIPAYNNNNCGNGYATIGNGSIAIGVGGGGGATINNNNNGSLRRYH